MKKIKNNTLIKLLEPNFKKILTWQCLLQLVETYLVINVTFITKNLIDGLIIKDYVIVKKALIFYLPVSLIGIFLLYPKFKLVNKKINYTQIKTIRKNIYNKIMYSDLNKNNIGTSGNIITSISNSIDKVISFIDTSLGEMVSDLFILVFGSVYLLYVNWRIFLIAILSSIITCVSIKFYSPMQRLNSLEIQKSKKENNILLSIIGGINIFNIYKGAKRYYKYYYEANGELIDTKIKHKRVNVLFETVFWLSNLTREILIIYVSVAVLNLQIGSLMAVINLSSFITGQLVGIVQKIGQYKEVKVAADDINEIYNYVEEFKEDNDDKAKDYFKGNNINSDKVIKLNSVDFSYNKEKNIFKSFNMEVNKNQIVGIVGSIGTGKSTLIKLLMGINMPTSGEVIIDNIKVTAENLHKIRDKISYVDQNASIFKGSIKQNITNFISNEEIDDKQLKKAIEYANLKEFINSLSEKLDYQLDYNGKNISGGQRQRIAIARAIYKKSPIIIFDEPSSALDQKNEDDLRKSIDKLKDECTILIISHRKAILKSVDKIIDLSSNVG